MTIGLSDARAPCTQLYIDGSGNSGELTELSHDHVTAGMTISWYSDSCCTEQGYTICSDSYAGGSSDDWASFCTRQLDERGDATGPFNPDTTDDDDFTSADMCCMCGGGRSTCDPTPRPSISYSPTPNPTTTSPTTPAPTISAAPTIPPTASWDVGMDHDLNFEECELDDLIGSMDASLEGGATCETGSGVYFDGISGYVDLSDQYMGGSLTFSLLVKAEDVGGTLFDIGQYTYYSSYYTIRAEIPDSSYCTFHNGYYWY